MLKTSKNYMPTYILIAANVAVYAWTSYLSGNVLVMSDYALMQYGQYNPLVLEGEVWRLFTAMFVHATIAHIVGNMLFLFIYGTRAEHMFDLKEYLAIYFLSGLTGSALTLLSGPDTLSIGASGAIFGILGATLIYARRAIRQSIMSALMFAIFLFLFNLSPNVNYLAHLGGLAIGLIIGYVLGSTRKPQQTVTYQHDYNYRYG